MVARSFYLASPDEVAAALLGKLLVRKASGEIGELRGRIVETEAYFGALDPAAHAFRGRTERTAVLFGPPGHAYVYLIYGMHHCLNVSCEPEGQAGCVLIRALEPVAGWQWMEELRGLPPGAASKGLLASGPGRLCQAFGITRARDNGADLTDRSSSLQICEDGFRAERVLVTPRIGIRQARDRMARYVLAGNACVSGRGPRSGRAGAPAAQGKKILRSLDGLREPLQQ